MLKAFPTKDYMKVALGILGWSPNDFWLATPHEVRIAFEGWQESRGVFAQQGMDSKILKELMQKFPDKRSTTKD